LKEVGLLVGERSGRFMHYRVQRDRIALVGKELNHIAEGSLKTGQIGDEPIKDSQNPNGCARIHKCSETMRQKEGPRQ